MGAVTSLDDSAHTVAAETSERRKNSGGVGGEEPAMGMGASPERPSARSLSVEHFLSQRLSAFCP